MHEVQVELRTLGEYLPGVHERQNDELALGWMVPDGQARQYVVFEAG